METTEKNKAEVVKRDGKPIYYIWCTECHKKIDEGENPAEIEITGKRHTLRTGHTTIIGCMVVLMRK